MSDSLDVTSFDFGLTEIKDYMDHKSESRSSLGLDSGSQEKSRSICSSGYFSLSSTPPDSPSLCYGARTRVEQIVEEDEDSNDDVFLPSQSPVLDRFDVEAHAFEELRLYFENFPTHNRYEVKNFPETCEFVESFPEPNQECLSLHRPTESKFLEELRTDVNEDWDDLSSEIFENVQEQAENVRKYPFHVIKGRQATGKARNEAPIPDLWSESALSQSALDEENKAKSGLYKHLLCKDYVLKNSCLNMSKCRFAHSDEELRQNPQIKSFLSNPKFRTKPCPRIQRQGYCLYGKNCGFIH
ncbi:hypothetical protein TCAL_04632 [Tigriopus californicus]|uniref:C3H1-type domain-containing protein n=1 Tax=Tigriopus californicus TaxID=6832 RepID=A0A553NB42_TIGCA|nr:hypothetical protein TCAL_04632 [Tigriopus californicus]|eukprot:TCALIF_04632-PA protein Name:"Similar to TIS11 mRNA decay factor CTH2 (Saccharomyces cerevisiae (strain ATCC 204508 / S288c))" AED:0.33 eAED:0.39 QI:0/-1/0/1/-1/1/1/0/298